MMMGLVEVIRLTAPFAELTSLKGRRVIRGDGERWKYSVTFACRYTTSHQRSDHEIFAEKLRDGKTLTAKNSHNIIN